MRITDLKAFLDQCRHLEMDFLHVPGGDRTLTFMRDDDGHLFEIK